MKYSVMAIDMDGTLLSEEKQLNEVDARAINRAIEAGKHAILGTGRCPGEIRPLLKQIPNLRYGILESGACIYDFHEEKVLHEEVLRRDEVEEICTYIQGRDIMPAFLMNGEIVISEEHFRRLNDFGIEIYRSHYEVNSLRVEDVIEYWKAGGKKGINKICLFHRNVKEREETLTFAQHLSCSLAFAEETSLEFTPNGCDKGIGLERFCRIMGIPMEETIAIGDSYNDLPMLEKAALAVAVGNAREEVKRMAGAVTADHNHGGVSEAIEKYLLAE